jgi:lipoyl-dependent peroxiredoxin
VPRVERRAHVRWQGSSARGSGQITSDTGAFAALPYNEPTRVGDPEGLTSPEELLAAAHAACFSMSLAAELTRAKAPPEHLEVTATVVLDEVEGRGHRIVESQLRARARADVDRQTFDRAVVEADEGCPFSNLIKASGRVTIDAELEAG